MSRNSSGTSRATVMAATTLLWCGLGAAANSAESIAWRGPADPRGEVEILNASGEVRVRGWSRNEVQVSGDLGRSEDQLDVRNDAKRISIKVVAPRARRSGNADLVVHVPQESTLSINTVSADQIIDGVRGAQRLQAVNGTITTQQWSQDIEAKTINGDVSIRSHGQPAETSITTVSGDINLTDASGEVTLETVSGDMEIRMDEMTRGRIRTTNGDLLLRARLEPEARLDAESINGDLRFVLRNPVSAQFDVKTFNGAIDNCFGAKAERAKEFAPGSTLRFQQGEGSARVRIKTLNGGIEICRD